MSRRKKPIAWNEPPPGALEWLRACIDDAKRNAERNEREDLQRHSERYGSEVAQRWLREDGSRSRLAWLVITLMHRLDDGEKNSLMQWWQSTDETSIEASNQRELASLGAFTGALRAQLGALCKHGVHTLPTDTPCVWCVLDRAKEQRGTPDQ
jgi:hypothetical protein